MGTESTDSLGKLNVIRPLRVIRVLFSCGSREAHRQKSTGCGGLPGADGIVHMPWLAYGVTVRVPTIPASVWPATLQ